MEDTQKAVNLFNFIKGLNELKKQTITDINSQIWFLYISQLPEFENYVQFFDRNRSSSDDVGSDITLLKVIKPEFENCPKPDGELLSWLNPQWSDYRYDGDVLIRMKERTILGNTSILHFSDNQNRVDKYNEWIESRKQWVKKQKQIESVRILFSTLVMRHLDLEADSETQELVIADGFFCDAENTRMNHPILTKRVKTVFDERNNSISIVDTDNTSELYTSMLRSIDDLNHENIGKYNSILDTQDYHPLDNVDTPEFLKSLIHAASTNSLYSDNGIPENWKRNSRFLLYREPVFILRKKLDGSVKAIESIIENINTTKYVPRHILDIISGSKLDIQEDVETESIEQKLAAAGGEDINIFLSKEANREQLEIAQRIEKHNAVLVQGPPGTGKTHTIANLLGHFLAQGKTVLITSHTSKALNVLKEKIDPEIRDLCVSVLDESKEDMEKSIDGIVEHMSTSVFVYKREMEQKAEERNAIIDELAKVRKHIYKLINQECNTIVINGESISPSDAAKYVSENAHLNYIPGEIRKNSPLPISFEEVTKLYKTNVIVTDLDEKELVHEIPDPLSLISPAHFSDYCNKRNNILDQIELIEKEMHWRVKLTGDDNSLIIRTPSDVYRITALSRETMDKFASDFSIYKNSKRWLKAAAIDGIKGGAYRLLWEVLATQIQQTVELHSEVVKCMFGHVIDDHSFDYSPAALDAIKKIRMKLETSGKIGKLDRALDKNVKAVMTQIKFDGREISSVDEVDIILKNHSLQTERNKCASYWNSLLTPSGAPSFEDLDKENPEDVALRWSKMFLQYLDWSNDGKPKLNSFLKELGLNPDTIFEFTPFDSEEDQFEKQLRVINDILPKVFDCINITQEVKDITLKLNRQLELLQTGKRASSKICNDLYVATKSGDEEKYNSLYHEIEELYEKYDAFNSRNDLISKIEVVAPEWAYAIKNREGMHGESTAPSTIEDAWKWKQYSEIIADILQEPYNELEKRSSVLSHRYRKVTAEYAEKSAWYHLLVRTEADSYMQQSLVGWKQTVKKIGKGTGKSAPLFKAKARKMMAECQKAVPAWIMTVDKALESLDPKENRFDIIIIDEASQSDLSSMAILYMAKKIIVVGDDKQVSPMAVGVTLDQIRNLNTEYLDGILHISHLFDAKTSIYDIAATTFQPLMLTEHFRCVPDIINYSNMLSYDWKIKPLRDAGTSKLIPATVNYRVDGISTGKVNLIEADAIVALIQACIEQPEYDGKTFGVITLVGEKQASIIQNKLYEALGLKEYQKRRILCGNSANFQGDERDVIFISMVDSNVDSGPLRMRTEGNDDSTKKRYNVAVSRAKDQIWVVNSLDSSNDLKTNDLRKTLLEYVKNPKSFELKHQEILAKSDSPFEVEVASYLVNHGYHISQQWPVGGYRIDMVALYQDQKVAIECDGEKYHGIDMVASDMERQTILERIGWRFIRIRGSEYYSNKEKTMTRVLSELHVLGIEPEESMELSEQKETDLLTRIKASAASKMTDSNSAESKMDAIASALSSTNNFLSVEDNERY